MVSDIDNNKQDDTDVIRAQDIVPPYNEEKYIEQSLKEAPPLLSASCPQHAETGAAEIPKFDLPQHAETSATEPAGVNQKVNEIPKFDLAEQIMAEQRKITAVRRKAPGKKTKAPDPRPRIQSTGCAVKPPPTSSEKGLIIAEIVARDIEKLYRGDSASLRNW